MYMDREITDEEFLKYWEEMEFIAPDDLTDEDRKKMIDDFKKDDIHLIIGDNYSNSDLKHDIEYRQCIDWPKASKQQMIEMKKSVLKQLGVDIEDAKKSPFFRAMMKELDWTDEITDSSK